MGWTRDEARTVKAEAADYVRELLTDRDVAGATRLGGVPLGSAPGPATVGIALGLAPTPDGSYDLAVRYRLGTPSARMVTRRLSERIGPSVDVRRTGRVHGRARAGPPAVLPAPRSQELTERIRPLRPGISLAHVDVTAGTLGAFVHDGEDLHLLSNHHVLVGPDGQAGDPIVQPGPADGGVDPQDRVAALAAMVELVPGEVARVDAALARPTRDLAEGTDPTYPGGVLSGTTSVDGGEQVEKIGRTTAVTRGVVSAIELDGLLVDFGSPLGTMAFDGQIEVEPAEATAFSAGGDSGSLVYEHPTMAAVGLLFAGSETGGAGGQGLTFLNPIDEVLASLQVTLHGVASAEAHPPRASQP